MIPSVDSNASPGSPPYFWGLLYLKPQPNLFLGCHFFLLLLFPVQLVSCSQPFAANVCLSLCPVNSVWPWERFLTQLAAHVLFSLNFGSRLNWIFRQHPGERSWESTFTHLKYAYGITSQPAFHWGKLCLVSAKTLPRSCSTVPPQINPIYTIASPSPFFQGTQIEQNQRRSAKCLVQGKPVPNFKRLEFTGNGIFFFLLNLSEHLKYFCQSEPVVHRVLVLNSCRKLRSAVMWLEVPHRSCLFLSPARWFSAPCTSSSHQVEAHSLSRWTTLRSAPISCAHIFLGHHFKRAGHLGTIAFCQKLASLPLNIWKRRWFIRLALPAYLLHPNQSCSE